MYTSFIKLKKVNTIMDVQNLQEKYPHLLSFMEENGYSWSYIRRFKTEVNHILREAKLSKWDSYTNVYLAYAKKSKSSSYLREKRNIIGAIERFDLEGIYPDRLQRNHILKKSGYDLLSDEFKNVIDIYCDVEKKRGKKEDTIYTESHNATTFLLSLRQKGMDSFNKITERAALEIFFQDGKLCRSCSYKKYVSAVFKACIPFFPENTCTKVLSYLPALREKRKNIQYLTREEVSSIKIILTESESSMCLRDKAIGLLALYMGLRSCDIAGLNLADIDWTNDLLRIRQQKTDVPLVLPLRATIGNAIYDYLKQERPNTQCEKVFITQTHPFTKLQGPSIYNVAKKIMVAANIRIKPGDRQGFHIFRHHMATSLLENGVFQPIISRTMGHVSPASLESYLSADFSHIKECALSIECFPLGKEVLL